VPIEVIDHPNPSTPALPAATVVLVRDGADGVEVLLIQRNARTSFGGMWAFPGGVIEEGDVPPGEQPDAVTAARRAAVREAMEEVALEIDEDSLVFWSHWLPPDSSIAPKRFSTWFFLAPAIAAHDVVGVDGTEIDDHRWITATAGLAAQQAGQVDLAPPTMVTLVQLSRFGSVGDALAAAEPTYYATRFAKDGDGTPVCMWAGDVAYDGGAVDAPGPRHRIVMDERSGWRFEQRGGDVD
jgi:8-oxo-dGTP pyrophosphatase MutT (NUDIX family)